MPKFDQKEHTSASYDLGSTNGTFVNEQQVYSNAPRLLQPGDTLRVGDTKFTFEVTTNAPQPASYLGGSTMRATPPPHPRQAVPE